MARRMAASILSKVKKANHVMLHFTDLLGKLRGRTIPASQAEEALTEGVGFDGSSIPGFVSIQESDMIMKPDVSTAAILPAYFYERLVANFICNIYTPEGKPYTSDPRYICQKATEKVLRQGYLPTVAAELEFYLVKKENGHIVPVENHIMENPRYFDIAPDRDLTETFRMDLCDVLSSMGFEIERQHHEVGSAQNEITFKHSTPTKTSDNIIRYKFVAKAIANKKYGWTATFMPKPWQNQAGNGMHIHVSLSHKNGKVNAFYDSEGYAHLSQTCRYFIGGLLAHSRALSAIVAPTVNSYKRLVPGYEAPLYIAWSRRNRSALIRVPEYFPGKENEARIEYRCPDCLCNPYLAYTVLFEAGMDGIRRKIEPGDPIEENVYHLAEAKRRELGIETLPSSLKEALEEWSSDDICVKALGKENAEKYLALKWKEWKEYEPHQPSQKDEITEWEKEKYLYM
ncbi:MAG: type I glutamate--ammonia ligase [Candidatus Bathyarchaeia archaeon]